MGYNLPLQGSVAREMFDISDLLAIAHGEREAPLIHQARAQARRAFEGQPAIKRIVFIALDAQDHLRLVSFGRRLGRQDHWDFGPFHLFKRREAA